MGLLILLNVDRVLLLDPEADAEEAGHGSGGA
jgi:Trm5-related predicted tRNA methylase